MTKISSLIQLRISWVGMAVIWLVICVYVPIAHAEFEKMGLGLAPGSTGDTTADAVLGQLDFVHNAKNFIDGRGLDLTDGWGDVAIDRSPLAPKPNRVFVADRLNHRILGWKNLKAFQAQGPADLVIGQPDFNTNQCNTGGVNAASLCYPSGVAVDSAGNLYVADTNNHRVLYYEDPFAKGLSAGISADDVFGQFGSFTANYCNAFGVTANALCYPQKVTVDPDDNLYIGDWSNHRVLAFYTPQSITTQAGSGDTTADRVFGQFDSFTINTANNSGVSKNSLYNPGGIATDGLGNLYVADYNNHRVLMFKTPLTTDTTADRVYGQVQDFTLNICNNGGITKTSLCYPTAVSVNPKGEVYVADSGNHRVLGYPATGTAIQLTTATKVLGQFASFNTQICNNTGGGSYLAGGNPRNLCTPNGLVFDSESRLYVADTRNNRVLQYEAPVKTNSSATGVVGQKFLNPGAPGGVSTNTSIANQLDGRGFALSDLYSGAGSVAIDISVTPNRIYVADSANNRVLAWNSLTAFATHAEADLVFGQPNKNTGGYNGFGVDGCRNGGISATSLCRPRGIAVDVSGNLYVADQDNHRVLIYKTPFATDTKADKVLGQGDSFTTAGCNQGGLNAGSLCTPVGIAVDGSKNLYVADHSNHRVLVYSKPLTTNSTADAVFGQSDSFTTNTCNQGGVNASSLCYPTGVAVDSQANLYVTDYGNHRGLAYKTPLTTNRTADLVFGQSGSFSTQACNAAGVTAASLCRPHWAAVDTNGNLYISDRDNHRVLRYNKPMSTKNTTADQVYGQGNLFTLNNCRSTAPWVTANALCNPEGLAMDDKNNLYVTDGANNRVLQFLKP